MPRSSKLSQRTIVYLFVLAAAIASPLYAQEATSETTTETTLANAPLEANINPLPAGEAPITLIVNGSRFGDLNAKIDLEDPFVQVSILRQALSPYLSEARIEYIFGIILSKLEWAGIADLAAAGVTGTWDMENLVYTVKTPGEYSSLRELDFASNTATLRESVWLSPARISGAVNFTVAGTATVNASGTTLPVSLSADASFNLWGLILEGDGSVSYNAPDTTWNFNTAKAIYDFPSIRARLFAGMISAEGVLYQSRSELYGISLHTIDEFSRYSRNYSPSAAFTLQEASTVRVVINGNVIRTERLEKGNYRIYDLPFAYGLNDFQLEVEQGKGADGTIIYKPVTKYVTLETGLLVGRQLEYGASFGIGQSELDQFLATGYARYGLTSWATMGVNAQADRRSFLGGIGFVIGSDIGGFIINASALGAWDGRSDPFAFACDAEYHFNYPRDEAVPTVSFAVNYNSQGFLAPQTVSTMTFPAAFIKASAAIGGSLAKKISYGLSGSWTKEFDSAASETTNLGLNLGIPLSRNSSVSMSSGLTFTTGEIVQPTLSFVLSASDPKKPGRQANLSQQSDGTNTISINDQIPFLGGLSYNIQANNLSFDSENASYLSLSTSASSQLATFSGGAGIRYGGNLTSPTGIFNFNMSTALSFADFTFALSKPIYDSFVIFDPDKSTGNMAVAFSVNSGEKIVSHGLPVAAPLNSYRQALALMDFPEADADTVATQPQAALATKLRTGFLYRAGIQRLLNAMGTLVDGDNKGISLVAGDIFDESGTLLGQTFSDEAGIFQLYGLGPGKYSIHWPENIGVSDITLVDMGKGIIDVGEVRANAPNGLK